MKQFHSQYDDDEDEFGVLKDGRSVRVSLMMADSAAPTAFTFNDADFSDADKAEAAYQLSKASANAWRDGDIAANCQKAQGDSAPTQDGGTFAPMHRDQLTSADALDRAQAAADAAYAKSVSSLNAGHPAAPSRASDAAEAMLMADEAYNKSVNDLNAWRNR